MNDSRPDSSGSHGERPVLNREAAGSTPARGSTYLYVLLRKDFDFSGAALSQYGHALTECLLPEHLPLPKDTSIVVLGATKEQLAKARFDLDQAGVHTGVVLEVDGPLAGCITSIGLLTTDRDSLKADVPLLVDLRPFAKTK